MSKRIITIRSGKEEIQMEITEEEYRNYYRPWWQQKKREQRNREAVEEKGYKEESYDGWEDGAADEMGVPDYAVPDMDEILEKKILLGMLEEAMGALLPEERELAAKVIGEDMTVCEFARMKGENRRTLAFRKDKVLEKLREFFREHGFDV